MANQSRTQSRSVAPRGRVGRGSSGSKTPASTSGRSLRARSGEAGPKGRFGLGSSLGPSGYGRSSAKSSRSSGSAPTWRPRPRGKSAPQQSGIGKALSAFTAMSGGKAAKKTTSRSAKPAGFALLAGAAGLALKNRDKLRGLAGRGGGAERHDPAASSVYGVPAGVEQEDRTAPSPSGTTEGSLNTPPDYLTDVPTDRSEPA